MIKKLSWVFVGIYTAAIMYLTLFANLQSDGFGWASIGSLAIFLLPAADIAFELAGKKVPLVVTLILFLMTAFFLVGILRFNALDFATMLKALLFGVALILLLYFPIRRKTKKS